jgi:glycolate oxidase FAD binding subunit
MSAPLAPASVDELIESVRSCPRLLAIGAGTKPRLCEVDATKVSSSRLRGVVEYEPSEFTFTAMAGTPIKELAATLSSRRQYLPFDPFLVEAGATLGGTVAAGLSGPGRLRFGGLKDFILGVRFVDGAGRLLRVGGKVVKNAAGFDLPKFFVGSLGRFGVLTELTFKVFPAPVSNLTLKLDTRNVETASRILIDAGGARWEADALDILPGSFNVCIRLAGPPEALDEIAKEILARWPGEKLAAVAAQSMWSDLSEFRWICGGGPLIKVVLKPVALPLLFRELQTFEGARIHVSSGGNVAYASLPTISQVGAFDEALRRLGLPAVTLCGQAPLWLGTQSRSSIAGAVKQALDPGNRFPRLDE